MTKILLLYALLSVNAAMASGRKPADAEEFPIDSGEVVLDDDSSNDQAFDALIQHFQQQPEWAGSEIKVCVGDQCRTVNRALEKVSPAPPASSSAPLLEGLVRAIGKSAGASANLHVEYKKTWLDEKGKPVSESLTIDAGAGWGTAAAASAQGSMDDAVSKNHR